MAEQLDQQLPATRNLHESLTRAEELATRRKHSVVGLDHLLLALGQDPDAVSVLLVCKVDVESLCMDLLRKLGPEARMRSPNTVPPSFDVTVQNLIAHASAAALQAGHTEIDGSNILSAIISGEGGMITNKILQKHGLTFNETVLNLEKKKSVKSETSADLKPANGTEENSQKTENSAKEEQGEPFKLVPELEPKTASQDQQSQKAPEAKFAGADNNYNTERQKSQTSQPLQGENVSIVQAEARPEDYGMTPEGSEYHPVPPKEKLLQKKEDGRKPQAQQRQVQVGPNGKPIPGAGPNATPMMPPLAPETGQRAGGQPQNLPPQNMPPQNFQDQNLQGQNLKGQMPPSGQPFRGDISRGLKDPGGHQEDPLPTILNKPKEQPKAGPAVKSAPFQTGDDPNNLQKAFLPGQGMPRGIEEQNSSELHQTNRKVSFDPAELKEPVDDPSQPKAPMQHQAQQMDQNTKLQQPSAENKFIQEDKYGTTPPSPPMPPHPGHVDLSQNAELEPQNLEPQNEALKKENTPLNLPPRSERAEEALKPLAGQKGALNQIQPNQLPSNQFPGQNLKGQQIPLQQNKGQQIQGQNIPLPQTGQHPAQQPHPTKSFGQAQGLDQGQGQIQSQFPGQAQTQEKMNDIANSMAQSQKNRELLSDQDQVVENIPKVMRVGKVHYLEVRVAKFANAEIELAPEDYGLRSKQNSAPITKAITVRLTGSDGAFLIDCATASTQWTEMQGGITNDADFAVWRWRVLPRKSGVSKLRLDITARTSNEDGLTAEIPIQPSKSIDVKVTRNYASIFKKLLIMAGIFAIGFAVAEYGLQAYEMFDDSIKEFSRKD